MAAWRTLSEMDECFARSRRQAAVRRAAVRKERRRPHAARFLLACVAVAMFAGGVVAEAQTPASASDRPRGPLVRDVCPIPPEYAKDFRHAARRWDIPLALLVAMAYEESEMDPNAVSHAGALGLLQLMPGTARALDADPTVPAENIRAGARYLREMLDRFADVNLALAAYNAGPNAVRRAGGDPSLETVAYVANVRARAATLTACS